MYINNHINDYPLIDWLIKANDNAQVLANQLIGTWHRLHPLATVLGPRPKAHWYRYCAEPSQKLWQPQVNTTRFPTTTPPGEEFLSSETILSLLFLRNPVGLNIFLERILITEI